MKKRSASDNAIKKSDDKQADILRAVSGVGLATKHYFVTRIKRAGDFETVEAENEFERLCKIGTIKQAGQSDSGVQYFEA